MDGVQRVDHHPQVTELRVVEHVLHLEHGGVRHVRGDELLQPVVPGLCLERLLELQAELLVVCDPVDADLEPGIVGQVLESGDFQHSGPELLRAGQAQGEAYRRQMQTAVENVTKNAPTGSEAAMAALNSAIAAANTLYETLQGAGQQAVEVTQSNLDMAAAASKSAQRAIDPVLPAAKR